MPAHDSKNLRILTFTSLYPNAAKPQHGIFVETRLRQLLRSGRVRARVLAPVPYFPFRARRFGSYSVFARVPRRERRFGIEIDHPRYLAIPKIGMSVAPFLLYASARRALTRLLRAGHHFDLIDAHYFYPDGVAAVMLGRRFGLPVTVTARGTDINVIPNYAMPRLLIRRAASLADGVITVSGGLARRLEALGVQRSRITVLRNGVDPELFKPVHDADLAGLRSEAGLAVSVGNLVPLKGHDLAIGALQEVPDLMLWIVGEGPERGRLEKLASKLKLSHRVRFLGAVPYERMPAVYSAADVLILASEREGWPNVLLEAMACGTRVISTEVSDVQEIVAQPTAGLWLRERSVSALVKALRQVLSAPIPRAATRAYAMDFTWEATTRGQVELFNEILGKHSENEA